MPDPFSLDIVVSGLSLVVPDPGAPSGPALRVLMEKPHHGEPHFARLIYDRAYERRDSTKLSGDLACVALDARRLTFGEPVGLDLDSIPDTVVSLHRISSIPPLERDQVEGAEGFAARMDLYGGRCTATTPGATWQVPNAPGGPWEGEITTCMTWSVAISRDRLDTARLAELKGEKPVTLPALYPIDGRVRVFVFNVPGWQLPPVRKPVLERLEEVKVGAEPEHFDAYFARDAASRVMPTVSAPRAPTMCGPEPATRSDCAAPAHELDEKATPYTVTCLLVRRDVK